MIKLKSLLKEGLFRTYTSLESSDFENFTKNYLKLNRKHVVKKKGKDVYLMTAKGVIIYHQKPCNKNRSNSLMFDGFKLVRVAMPNKNWSWCKGGCGMAIRNEHQRPPKPKLTHEQMFGKKRIYQGSIPKPSPDVEAVIRWQASKARGEKERGEN